MFGAISSILLSFSITRQRCILYVRSIIKYSTVFFNYQAKVYFICSEQYKVCYCLFQLHCTRQMCILYVRSNIKYSTVFFNYQAKVYFICSEQYKVFYCLFQLPGKCVFYMFGAI